MIEAARAASGDDMAAFLCWLGVRVIQTQRILKPTGSLYLHCAPTASHYLKILLDGIFGPGNFKNEIVWSYRRWTGKSEKFQSMRHILLFHGKTRKSTWTTPMQPKASGTPQYKRWNAVDPTTGRMKIYSDKSIVVDSTSMRDVWPISRLQSNSTERTGYPTQKPLALYKRTINASSNENNNMSERLQGTLRERLKALRGLKGQTTGQRYLDGWAVNCNYFRPHMAIKSTPGKAAKMDSPFTSWQDVARAGLPTPPKREHKLKRHGTASTQQCCTKMPTNYNQTVPKHAGKRREQDHDF